MTGAIERIAELGTILGVWAHPDDETYLSGGVMAAAAAAGQRVVCLTATPGERGTDDPERWPPERLATVRRGELADALAILGVRDHHWLGYRDGECEAADPDEAETRVTAVLSAVRPDTVLTFGPDGMTGHPDHVAVGRWALAAARRATPPPVVLQAVKDTGWVERFTPLNQQHGVFGDGYPVAVQAERLDLHIVLPDGLLDRKVAALRAHASQVDGLLAAVGEQAWREWIRTESFVRSS